MALRYLFGPVSASFADQNLRRQRQAGVCLTFNFEGNADLIIGPTDTWGAITQRFPAGWQPDVIVLDLAYTTVPKCLWSVPVPLIGLAEDWNLLWHYYRRRLRCCELIMTDTAGVEVLAREGIAQAHYLNLYGVGRDFLEAAEPERQRDIDLLFVGNLHEAVQRERAPWLARLVPFARRWRVVIETGVFGDAYRDLLGRARIVFNRSIRGECNKRALEAAAAGALLLQEAENREVPQYFRDRHECVYYTADNLESLLTYYLEHEAERRTIAEAARAKVQQYRFEQLWQEAVEQVIEPRLPQLQKAAGRRPSLDPHVELQTRLWQALSTNVGTDPRLGRDLAAALVADPNSAPLANALGVAMALAPSKSKQEPAGRHFQRAYANDRRHVLAGLNWIETLVDAQQPEAACAAAQELLARLTEQTVLDLDALDAGHFPPVFDYFRVEWERAAWSNAGQCAAEVQAKRQLLRWRLHTLLARLTDERDHYYEAVLARPDLPVTQAALGCALGRVGKPLAALEHLEKAVAANPLDLAAVRALHQALGEANDQVRQHRLAQERRLWSQAAPRLVPREAWWADLPPPKDEPQMPPGRARLPSEIDPTSPETSTTLAPIQRATQRMRVSLCMMVKNEEQHLPDCLRSVADLVDDIVVVDTGSNDQTKVLAAEWRARVFDFAWVDSFAAARNESIRHATGDWIFWLDADDRLDAVNRDCLRALFQNLQDDNAAYVMKCLCLPDPESQTATVVDHIRLFRNHPELRWKYRVHEQILPAVRRLGGTVRWSDVVIHHVGYQDPAQRQRKLARDLRLLQLEDAEHPDEPFTLFNLGSVFQEMGRWREALPLLRRSLERSQPGDSIVRKLFALIVQCHRHLGQPDPALAACRAGRRYYPDDAELLFQEGLVRRGQSDASGAEACWLRLLQTREEGHFASVATGLRGSKTRHNLAVLYHEQGRVEEAEALWQEALAEEPDFRLALQALTELYREQARWFEWEQTLQCLERQAGMSDEAAVLRARGYLARNEFVAARQILQEAIDRSPQALSLRVILSHVLLQDGQDWAEAEQSLRDVLALDANHGEARRNLSLLLQRQEQAVVI